MSRKFKTPLLWGIVVLVGLAIGLLYASNQAKKIDDPNLIAKPVEKPLIIWFHNAATTKSAVLERALSSNIVTHVLIWYLNPEEAPLAKQKKIIDAVTVCKKYNIKIIWCRALWPIHEVKNFKEQDITDPNYYSSFIRRVCMEAELLGAEFTCVDTEPYGYFPFKKMFGNALGKERFEAMQKAVDNATQKEGKLDFVLPVGGPLKNLMYDAVIGIGKIKIAEHTYFDIPAKIHDNRRPYDVLGAYISIRKTNKAVPEAPYFTVQEILERQYLWRDKTGLMLYPKEDEVEAVADQLSQIKTIVPRE